MFTYILIEEAKINIMFKVSTLQKECFYMVLLEQAKH